MWERHSLQPAAQRILGTDVSAISHFSSYSCRAMRTSFSTVRPEPSKTIVIFVSLLSYLICSITKSYLMGSR